MKMFRPALAAIAGQAHRLPNLTMAGGAPALQIIVALAALGFATLGARAIEAQEHMPKGANQPRECIDSWTATSTINAPTARYGHTAVWTGSEMIVWGGTGDNDSLNTGGRYNPSTDSWTPMNTINAPSPRANQTAVWTGSEMIVWGGSFWDDDREHDLNTGGRYNPITDSWTATNTTNVPTVRSEHTAVWTGSEMIVWGGIGNSTVLNTGGRYNPITDSWVATSTSNAPTAREFHTAAFVGDEMIVWVDIITTAQGLTPAAGIIPTATVGPPPARIMHRPHEIFPRQCPLALK